MSAPSVASVPSAAKRSPSLFLPARRRRSGTSCVRSALALPAPPEERRRRDRPPMLRGLIFTRNDPAASYGEGDIDGRVRARVSKHVRIRDVGCNELSVPPMGGVPYLATTSAGAIIDCCLGAMTLLLRESRYGNDGEQEVVRNHRGGWRRFSQATKQTRWRTIVFDDRTSYSGAPFGMVIPHALHRVLPEAGPAKIRGIAAGAGGTGSASAVEPPRITNRSRRLIYQLTACGDECARLLDEGTIPNPHLRSPASRKCLCDVYSVGARSQAPPATNRRALGGIAFDAASGIYGPLGGPRENRCWRSSERRLGLDPYRYPPGGPMRDMREPTTPVDLVVECCRAALVVTLHPDCFVMWDEARKFESST
jgi:hypothetical protein